MTADFDVGTNATHTCNDGFILTVGSETRECLPGGIWSGRIPVCQRIRKICSYYRVLQLPLDKSQLIEFYVLLIALCL